MLGSILGLAGELNGVVLRLEYGDTPLPAQRVRSLQTLNAELLGKSTSKWRTAGAVDVVDRKLSLQ